jgi:hypothetical protein
VVLDAADATRVRDPDHHRQRDPAAGAVAHLRHVADDLLECGVGERVELHLHHRAHAVHRHADGHPDDAGLGQRRVEAPVRAELGGQPVGDPEDTAERAHVLAEDDHGRVGGERVAERPVQRLRHREFLVRHRSAPSRATSSATSAACSVSCGVGLA